MTPPAEDRRVSRTRQRMRSALTELMQRKRYDRITVQDILDRAEVSRSTFYAHCRDKDDLLLSGFERVLESVTRPAIVTPPSCPEAFPTVELFRHVGDHRHLYRALVWGGAAELVFQRAQTFLEPRFEAHLAALLAPGHRPSVPLDALARFATWTLMGQLRWWLEQERPDPPERVDAVFQELVLPGVLRILRPPQ